MSIVFAGIMLSGPVALVGGWLRWLRARPRFDAPVWRSVPAFVGLTAASVAYLATGVALAYIKMGVYPSSWWYDAAFWACALPLFLAAVGKGPQRWHVAYSSVVLLYVWINLMIAR